MANSSSSTTVRSGAVDCLRYLPSDEEYITDYLVKKVKGDDSVPMLKECSLYGYGDEHSPWNVLKEDDPSWEDSASYADHRRQDANKKIITVYCKLTFVSAVTKDRVFRISGCGSWSINGATEEIENSRGEVIGYKKRFSFKPGEESEANGKGRWVMLEYSLPPPPPVHDNRRIDLNADDFVVCRIHKYPN